MEKMTLLDEREISKKGYQLSCMKDINKKAEVTDFSILLGVDYTNEGYGSYWTRSNTDYDSFWYMNKNQKEERGVAYYRDIGIRPVIVLEENSDFPMNVDSKLEMDSEKNIIVEYGYYPQSAVSKELNDKLENCYKNNNLIKSNNQYAIDGVPKRLNEFLSFKLAICDEYEFEDKLFIRYIVNGLKFGQKVLLSNGQRYENGDTVWIEVEPVEMILDFNKRKMVSSKIICGGIPFCNKNTNAIRFDETNMYKFINEYLLKEMFYDVEKKYLNDYKQEVNKSIKSLLVHV